MKKLFLFVLIFLSSILLFSQNPPGTEIYLLDIRIKKSGITITNPKNITNHPGYDNQPFFHPERPTLYYTSANEEGRTDIHFYDYNSTEIKKLTNTLEREYSPTLTPDKKYISCIIQRDDGVQDLGKYPLNGGTPIVLISNLIVGYHAWSNDSIVFIFALGQPNTLRIVNIKSGKDTWIADSIGRSIHRIPKSNLISFIDKSSEHKWFIKRVDSNNNISIITETIPDCEDLVWTPDKKIIMSDGKNLFYYDTEDPAGWIEVKMPPSMPSGSISRLAINVQVNKLAVVIAE